MWDVGCDHTAVPRYDEQTTRQRGPTGIIVQYYCMVHGRLYVWMFGCVAEVELSYYAIGDLPYLYVQYI